jgi:hypothetical protein
LAELKLPTLQHFSTFCGGTVEEIVGRIAFKNGGGFGISYTQLREKHLSDIFNLGSSVEQVRKCCENIKFEKNRKANIGALDALAQYLKPNTNKFAVPVERKYYPIGRNLLVPVNPPFVLSDGQSPKLFWPSFWKTPGRLDGVPGAVFGTILDRVFFSRPDFAGVELEFLDMSSLNGKGSRSLRVYKKGHFPVLGDVELRQELDKFVEAYFIQKSTITLTAIRKEPVAPGPIRDLPLFKDFS